METVPDIAYQLTFLLLLFRMLYISVVRGIFTLCKKKLTVLIQ
jgi:hypothetical protein